MKKYCFKGEVVQGQKLGRKIGFPTANLDQKFFDSSFKKGVYSAQVVFKINSKKTAQYSAVLFFGPKTIAKETKDSLEVHILNFDQNIYGETIEVCLTEFIREPMTFTSVEKLVAQIKRDVLVAKKSI